MIKEPPNRVIGLGYALDEFLIDPGRKGLQLSCAPKYLFAPCKLFLQKRSLPSITIRIDAAIMIGGVVRMFVDGRKNVDDKKKEEQATDGTLYCAGMIAGEGLVGILLAILAVVNVSSVFDLSGSINLGNAGGVILMLLMILSLLKFRIWNKKKA